MNNKLLLSQYKIVGALYIHYDKDTNLLLFQFKHRKVFYLKHKLELTVRRKQHHQY